MPGGLCLPALKRMLLVFAVLAMSVVSCLAGISRAMCRDELVTSAVAPDGRYVTELFVDDCSSRIVFQIAARPERQFLWWQPDRTQVLTFIGTTGWGRKMSWQDKKSLLIDYSESTVWSCDRLSYRTPQWRDVHIEYRGRCEPDS